MKFSSKTHLIINISCLVIALLTLIFSVPFWIPILNLIVILVNGPFWQQAAEREAKSRWAKNFE